MRVSKRRLFRLFRTYLPMLSYWFYPNPGSADYLSPKVLILFSVLAVFFLASFALSHWRKHQNSITRKLTKSWPGALRIFAIVGVVLVVCRVEDIQFFAMRILWVFWLLALTAFVLLQAWLWKKMHYTIVQRITVDDPRAKYLPGKGK